MPGTTFKYFLDKDGNRSQLDYNGLAGIPIEVSNRVEVLGETEWVRTEYLPDMSKYAYTIDEDEYLTDLFIPGDSYVLTVDGKEYYCKAGSTGVLFEPNGDYREDQILTISSYEDGLVRLLVPTSKPAVTAKVEKADIVWQGLESITKVHCGSGVLVRDTDSESSTHSDEPNFVKYTCTLYPDVEFPEDWGWTISVPIPGELCEFRVEDLVLFSQCCGIDEHGYPFALPLFGETRISDLHFTSIDNENHEPPAEFFVMLDETQLGNLDGCGFELYYYPITKGAPRLYFWEASQQDCYGFSIFDWVSFEDHNNEEIMYSEEFRMNLPAESTDMN